MPIRRFADPPALFQAAARRVAEQLQAAIDARGQASLALAGGSTPRGLYQQLAQLPAAQAPDWHRVAFYFGDERAVPPDHPDANYRMAHENLLGPLKISPTQIHRIEAERPQHEVEAHYRQRLAQLPQQDGWPCLDLILLGMGDDGHTASLFPGSALLAEQQVSFIGAEVPGRGLRYSLTLPVLNHARQLMLLVSGKEKAAAVAQALQEPAAQLPVQQLAGQVTEWYLDHAAAAHLKPEALP